MELCILVTWYFCTHGDRYKTLKLTHDLIITPMDATSCMLPMQGLYEDSIRYYVRAVAMNPKADNAWQYLRISLRYALYA
jgi:hypothetical protein